MTTAHLAPHEIWMLRVGFSYALEALWREIGGNIHMWNEVDLLRNTVCLLPGDQPPCVKDRFAFFAQTVRLSREQTDQLRGHIFKTGDARS